MSSLLACPVASAVASDVCFTWAEAEVFAHGLVAAAMLVLAV